MDGLQSTCASLERDDVRMVESPKMSDVGFLDVPDFLHGHLVLVELSEEYRALRSASEPLKIRDALKWNFPII